MTEIASPPEFRLARNHQYKRAIGILHDLPDRCAADVEELANRIGAEKLTLLGWLRADLQLARLVASKISQ